MNTELTTQPATPFHHPPADERLPQSILCYFVPFDAPVAVRRDAGIMFTPPRTEKVKNENRENNE